MRAFDTVHMIARLQGDIRCHHGEAVLLRPTLWSLLSVRVVIRPLTRDIPSTRLHWDGYSAQRTQ